MGRGEGRGGANACLDTLDEMDDSQRQCVTCCGSTVLLTAVILAMASFSAVGPLQYGLHFSNWNNKMVLNSEGEVDVYGAGRYFIGVGHTFIRFPTNCVTIDFTDEVGSKNAPLMTRTKDGLPVTLHISLQYRLKEEALIDLYTELNIGYEATFIRNARDALLEEAGSHLAPEYWLHRKEIGELMLTRLSHASGLAQFVDIVGVQILTVLLPSAYERSIMQTQVSVQQQKKAAFEQMVERVNSETAQLVNTYNNTVSIMLRQATAEAEQIKQNALATARRNTIMAEAAAYADAQSTLGLTPAQLQSYRWFHTMMEEDNGGKVLVNMEGGQIVNV